MDEDVVGRLIELGFSQYEAQAYLGLVGKEPMTGYALANATGIPQPKVYETLRRLERKGVAVPLPGDPARFVALPPAQLLSQLEGDFRRRLSDAEVGLARATAADGETELTVMRVARSWNVIEKSAVDLLGEARRHVYVSINLDDPARVIEAVERLDSRGIPSEILHFGEAPLNVSHGRLLRHETTDGILYRHHQARHLAIVADGSKVLWSLAADGRAWESVSADDALLAAAIKGYIRHDIYVQQIARDFGDVLAERYGPGLEDLVVPQRPESPGTAAKPSRRRRSA
jgi:sugar-specific transcriptional regulator TrmB